MFSDTFGKLSLHKTFKRKLAYLSCKISAIPVEVEQKTFYMICNDPLWKFTVSIILSHFPRKLLTYFLLGRFILVKVLPCL